jgi:hypothetical protein
MPTAENANATKTAAGSANSPHQDGKTPANAATTRNPAAYAPPRSNDQVTSPTATSRGPMGVARTES